MRLVKGREVYVETPLFTGWATVVSHVNDPFYPIQIELKEGDSDGHRLKRVSRNDIQEVK